MDTATKTSSKRNSLRFKFQGKRISYMARGNLGKGNLINISFGGCFVSHANMAVSPEDPILLVLELEELERPMELKGQILRATDSEFSMVFTELDESYKTEFTTLLAKEIRKSRKK